MANTILNTILADSFRAFALYFEQEGFTGDAVQTIIAETLARHGRIIFNGNNYSAEWAAEAERRGLPIVRSSMEAFSALLNRNAQALLADFGVFSRAECLSRYEILTENYNKTVEIEASVMLEMVHRQILPAVGQYLGHVAENQKNFAAAAGHPQQHLAKHLCELDSVLDGISSALAHLEKLLAEQPSDHTELGFYLSGQIRPAMEALRECCDRAETITDRKFWPIPSYTRLLYEL